MCVIRLRASWYNAYGSPIWDPQEQLERNYIEVCDFANMPRKLEKYNLDSNFKTFLLTLYEPIKNCPFSLERSIYRDITGHHKEEENEFNERTQENEPSKLKV